MNKSDNSWTYRWDNLPKTDNTGATYTYTVTEAEVPKGYKCTTQTVDAGGEIKNELDTTSVTATKVWDDQSNKYSLRPTSLTLTVKQNNNVLSNAPEPTVNKSDNSWTYRWDNLPKTDNTGATYTYTVTEAEVPKGYKCTTQTVDAGGEIKNELDTTNITLIKTWNDSVDNSFRVPVDDFANYVTLNVSGLENLPDPTVTQNGNQYTVTWANLPIYNSEGTKYVYTVTEQTIQDGQYTLYQNGTISKIDENEYEYRVTNTRNTASVYLGKQVTGNMGDRTEEFEFTVVIKDKNGSPITIDGVTNTTHKRKHGDATIIGGNDLFPVGATVTITEVKKTPANQEDTPYSVTSGKKDGAGSTNASAGIDSFGTVTFRVSNTGNTVTFYNDKEVKVDTGVPMTTSPYLFLLGLIPLAGLGAVLAARKRRRDEA